MRYKVIHVVNDLGKVNFGIWNAAIGGASWLSERYGIETEVWVCDGDEDKEIPFNLPVVWLGKRFTRDLRHIVASNRISGKNTLVVSHGCWLMSTRVGHALKQMGFPWVYVPHGMLEPWSMAQGRLKKYFYYNFVEKRLANRADAIRAVSKTEMKKLEPRFHQKISLIENGVDVPLYCEKPQGEETFLFMARLHYKKGILPLVKAWTETKPGSGKRLIIAGPDEGELAQIRPYLSENIQYVGPVYGERKTQLLSQSHYYMLPSYSEGFPTSVVEAMSFGLIPVISHGCNFPEVFSEKLGYEVEPSVGSIKACLAMLKEKPFDSDLSLRAHQFIRANYSTEQIGEKLFLLFDEIIGTQRAAQHALVL